jgi:hypothetical protein
MLRRPSTVVIETCVSRLSDLLPGADVPRSQWWLFSRVEVEGVPEHLPGHPTAHELAARLSTKPGKLVPVDSLSADLRTLLRSGIAADVTVEMIRPRFHGITESKLEVVGHASVLRFVVKPRQIDPFDDCVVAFAPELGTYDAAYSSTHQDTGPGRPHVPWLPEFHQAFAELRTEWESTYGEPSPLHLCCLARRAICVAGSSHMPPVKPLALRFERDEAAPGSLIIALDVPADELLSRLRDLPQTTSSMDMWRLACEDALATDDDLGQDPSARKALAVPTPHPRRRKLRQQQHTRYRLLDCLLGHAALLPLNVLASLAARRLGISPGDDMRAALSAATLHGVRRIVFADRSINLTVRRVGTAVRKAVTKAVPAVTGGLAVVCFMFNRMTGMYIRTQLVATGAGVLAVAAIACFCGALAVLVIAPSALVARIMTPSPREATQRLRASQFQALLDERDTNLAGQLRCLALSGMPPAHAPQIVLTHNECGGGVYALSTGRRSDNAHADLPPGADDGCIVAVVGAAHVPGILAKWRAYGLTADSDG